MSMNPVAVISAAIQDITGVSVCSRSWRSMTRSATDRREWNNRGTGTRSQKQRNAHTEREWYQLCAERHHFCGRDA